MYFLNAPINIREFNVEEVKLYAGEYKGKSIISVDREEVEHKILLKYLSDRAITYVCCLTADPDGERYVTIPKDYFEHLLIRVPKDTVYMSIDNDTYEWYLSLFKFDPVFKAFYLPAIIVDQLMETPATDLVRSQLEAVWHG